MRPGIHHGDEKNEVYRKSMNLPHERLKALCLAIRVNCLLIVATRTHTVIEQ